jgi:hypothetical protein
MKTPFQGRRGIHPLVVTLLERRRSAVIAPTFRSALFVLT